MQNEVHSCFENKKPACGQSVNSGERENLFSIFCWLSFLGVQVRAQHGEFSQGACALMLKNLGDCEEFKQHHDNV